MTFSVLMSVYKNDIPKYFDQSLHSIWTNQNLKPNYIVLVKDGFLNNDLIQIIEKWKNLLENKLILVENEINLGLTKSLNKGLSHITTDLVARMDSDDISSNDRFEKQIKFLKENSDISICGGSLQEFDETSTNLGKRIYPLNNDAVLQKICKASPLAHPSVMMRMDIFKKGLKYDEQYRTSQDIALWYDALCKGYKIANLPDVILHFRCSDDMFKRRGKGKAMNEFKIYTKGIFRMHGLLSYRYMYPFLRLLFRLMPSFIVKIVYGSLLRKIIIEK